MRARHFLLLQGSGGGPCQGVEPLGSESPSAITTAYRFFIVAPSAKVTSALKNGAGPKQAKGSDRANHSGGCWALAVSSAISTVEKRQLSSCWPTNASHGPRVPRSSSPVAPPGPAIRPPANSRGPRQKSPP